MLLVMGSNDTRVAEYAAQLWHQQKAPYILFTGGVGFLTEGVFTQPEAELFAQIAKAHDVPDDAILIETQSSNSGENCRNSAALLRERGLEVNSCILLQKPFMERRAYATVRCQWPELTVAAVSSPRLTMDEYCALLPKDDVIHAMVGHLHRILEYPKRGFQIEQSVPAEVLGAWETLVEAGYTQHLVAEAPQTYQDA
ncbi:uncharacterized protein MONBRDRAFT_28601 [Monosiga brevicollis MX1]|uniref:DUF218 domain-containing protein n=1 Tax=Monosiga brevicollis TaxID=81824 RepID=A9V8N1_MONBE|nr:uncharacterized protein MONBRDRAFT_28601 [Monosiga brevicollis MX1]EDQ86172.1 predicted protein [Monosiga brevicollis MX1]|eukprot:XP_001749097.1 hypothetical protein [Monosiga brevicollis MX1]